MGKQTSAQLADQAAEAIRELNHRTMWDDAHGYEWPSDVNSVVAGLASTSWRMGQAIEQAQRWLAGQGQQGRVGFDADGTDLDLPQALTRLLSAADLARQLGDALDGVMQHTAHLTGIDPEGRDL